MIKVEQTETKNHREGCSKGKIKMTEQGDPRSRKNGH